MKLASGVLSRVSRMLIVAEAPHGNRSAQAVPSGGVPTAPTRSTDGGAPVRPSVRAEEIMLDRKRLRRDLLALVLLVASLFLTLSLVSYDPADPPGRAVFPAAARGPNPC